ncbi:MAG TPA: extracellular solute-binding protein [Anaerolineales bacterium]|nr:extracellular solute-binding protein [Anaerolineales bacterium]
MKKIMVGLFILVILLANCAQSPIQETNSTPEPPSTPTDSLIPTQESTQSAPEPTILRLWVPPQFDPASDTPSGNLLQERLEQYTAQRPDIRIETRVKASSGSGGLLDSLSSANAAAPMVVPDLILLPRSSLEIAALKGLLFPYDGLTSTLNDSDWYPYAQELGQLQTSTFGLPFAGNALVSLYRPSEIEMPATDWLSALEVGQPIAFPAAEEEAYFPLAEYLSTGAPIQDADGRPFLDIAALTDVLNFFQEAESAGVMPFWLTQFTNDEQSLQAYTENQVNTTVTWINRYLSTLPGDTAAAPIITQDGTPFTLASGWVWALSNPQTERHAVSVDLAEFLTDSGFLTEWSETAGYLPPRASALEGWSNVALRNLVTKVVESARLIPSNEVMAVFGPALNQATVAILKQQSTPARAATEAIESLESQQ